MCHPWNITVALHLKIFTEIKLQSKNMDWTYFVSPRISCSVWGIFPYYLLRVCIKALANTSSANVTFIILQFLVTTIDCILLFNNHRLLLHNSFKAKILPHSIQPQTVQTRVQTTVRSYKSRNFHMSCLVPVRTPVFILFYVLFQTFSHFV